MYSVFVSCVVMCHAGAAYLEAMQQIMAAVQSASQLEVAELIQGRAADGSLPPSGATNDITEQLKATSSAAAAAADVLPTLSKRKAMDTEQAGMAESQVRNAKRARVEEGSGEQAQEAWGVQAGLSGVQDQHARDQAPAGVVMPGDETMQSAQPGASTQNQPGPSTHTQPGPSTQTQSRPGTQTQPAPSTQTQPGPHTQAQPEPSIQTQPGPSSESQPEPSRGAPDQDMEEEADPAVKEKREQARSRSRAWRKVLLDGLDLQSELTAAAVQQPHLDSALVEAEVKVRPFLLLPP